MNWKSWWHRKAPKETPDAQTPQVEVADRRKAISADNPVSTAEQDALNRYGRARIFAEQVLALDASEGVVVGVLGPWGSGKTSFVNLARLRFAELGVPALEFNPWMFSGAEQLVQSFFVELSAQLKMRGDLSEVGKLLEDYGETFSVLAWIPLVGPWIERGKTATKLLSKLLQRKKEGIGERRSRIRAALTRLGKPIVVVLDDIDRLTTPEIRDVFKLVRLTANFPNIIYVLAFDRQRVEDALSEQGIPGRSYLEKILQVGTDLPAIPSSVLNSQLFKAIDTSLADIDVHGHFDEQIWPDVFMEVIRPLIRNMRDVRRYCAGIHGTVKDLGAQVALVDTLALEAVRIFLPDVLHGLHEAAPVLTNTGAGGHEADQNKQKIDELLARAGKHSEVVRRLIHRLFPAAQRYIGGTSYAGDWQSGWLKKKRVAHEAVLLFYLERVMGDALAAFTHGEQAWPLMADQQAFDTYLRSVEIDRLQDVIASLEAYQDQFAAEHVVPGTVTLLNLLPDLPVQERGFLSFDTRMVVIRVVLRLVRAPKNAALIETAVRRVLPQLHSLGSKTELILLVGHHDKVGHRLIGEDAAKALESAWRDEVRAAPHDRLISEKDLFSLLQQVKQQSSPDEPALQLPDSPRFTLAVLRSARSTVRSQAVGNRAIRHSYRLPWDALVHLFGDEAVLHQRVEALRAASLENAVEHLELVDRYLAGERPGDFEDDED